MPQHSDTIELRRQFAEKFLASPQDHDRLILDGEMDQLIAEFDGELAAAKKRFPSLDSEREWAEMDTWLSERDYHDPQYLED